jgi:septum formation protein
MTKVLILASTSPRRQQLLREAGIAIEVRPSHIHEEHQPGESPVDYVSRLAKEKAETVARELQSQSQPEPKHGLVFVLGADTTVIVDDAILEKPRDAADARRMLRLLSGRAHAVTTAVSVARPRDGTITRTATTQVFFKKISEQEIDDYVAGGEPMDKAGAYAIQGGAGRWVERIEGEYSNVVGLPLSLVKEMLREAGFL